MDYFTLAGVCKRTGATEDELAIFGLRENIDNALDFSEVNIQSSYDENPEIFVDVKYKQRTKLSRNKGKKLQLWIKGYRIY